MKKFFFYSFLLLAICLFFLFSCARTDSLYDVVAAVTANDITLPAGKILCYGRGYASPVSEETLSEYLGLGGYPAFQEKIEDLAVYSTLQGEYAELAVMRLYRSSDAQDGALFFERRIQEAARALKMSGKAGYAEQGYVRVYGNIVALYMMPDNAAAEKKVKEML